MSAVADNFIVVSKNQNNDKVQDTKTGNESKAQESTMDVLAENGIDFEAEDESYYSSGEKELLMCLLSCVKENARHFR